MRVISVRVVSKENEVVVREVRHLFLVCKDALQSVTTQIVKDCSKSVLIPIIEELASKASVIYSDGFKSVLVSTKYYTSNFLVLI